MVVLRRLSEAVEAEELLLAVWILPLPLALPPLVFLLLPPVPDFEQHLKVLFVVWTVFHLRLLSFLQLPLCSASHLLRLHHRRP